MKILDDTNYDGQFKEIVSEIVKNKHKFQQSWVIHIMRKANNLAYSFVKAGLSLSSYLCFYD